MKLKFYVLLAFLVISFSSYSQIRILFDATKAESASNADWVIDADLNNLGFSASGASVGSGTESNPQQFPTPDQSTVTSTTPETYWKGAISSWGIDCAKQGYQVETLPYNGKITYGLSSNLQDLSRYKVFIVCEPNIVFSVAEKVAILNFVRDGGGLFMVSDHNISDRNNDSWDSPHIWNDLMTNNMVETNPFGIAYDYVNIVGASTNINLSEKDSILKGPIGTVSQAEWFNGTTMTLSPTKNASATGKIFTTGSSITGTTNVMFATARYGKGKVAAIGDSSPCDDGTGDTGDTSLYNGYWTDAAGNHRPLLMNATIWLATSKTLTAIDEHKSEHMELTVYPNPVRDGNLHVQYVGSESTPASLRIMDLAGKTIKMVQTNTNTSLIDVAGIPTGTYMIRATSEKSVSSHLIEIVQ
ncbi:MAG: T9SS type A sorting domain-containing protein [Paludibacter sp.]|nr:T9SS type A sorting domain-containing protein [Paludibacter sp.]